LFRLNLAVFLAFPAAFPAVLILPVLWIAYAWLGFDVIEPGVFHAAARRPNVFAGHGACMAPDAFIEVENFSYLRAYSHYFLLTLRPVPAALASFPRQAAGGRNFLHSSNPLF